MIYLCTSLRVARAGRPMISNKSQTCINMKLSSESSWRTKWWWDFWNSPKKSRVPLLFQGYTKAAFWNRPQELFFVDLLVSYDWWWMSVLVNWCAIPTFSFGNGYKLIRCVWDVALNMVMSMISTNWLDFQNICVFPLVDGGNLCCLLRPFQWQEEERYKEVAFTVIVHSVQIMVTYCMWF